MRGRRQNVGAAYPALAVGVKWGKPSRGQTGIIRPAPGRSSDFFSRCSYMPLLHTANCTLLFHAACIAPPTLEMLMETEPVSISAPITCYHLIPLSSLRKQAPCPISLLFSSKSKRKRRPFPDGAPHRRPIKSSYFFHVNLPCIFPSSVNGLHFPLTYKFPFY